MMSKDYIRAKKPVFACCLRLGGDYIVEHVSALERQVREHTSIEFDFICLTDHYKPIPGVITMPLLNNWSGWWSKVEMFRTIGPTVLMDLDTVIKDNIDDLFLLATRTKGCQFFMLSSFIPPRRSISGVMVYNGDWTWLYNNFDYKKHSVRFRGDEDYINAQLRREEVFPKFIQDEIPGVYSYKRNCLESGIPSDCKILVFHGQPRPWHVPYVWNQVIGAHK